MTINKQAPCIIVPDVVACILTVLMKHQAAAYNYYCRRKGDPLKTHTSSAMFVAYEAIVIYFTLYSCVSLMEVKEYGVKANGYYSDLPTDTTASCRR